MKTLIYGKYYEITPDTEVVYLDGEILPICDDGCYHWGIYYGNEFIRLHTFEVEGTIWYFTNDFQELEIRDFVKRSLHALGHVAGHVEWFRTIALTDDRYNDQYAVLYKLRGLESYHSADFIAGSEADLIRLILESFQSLPR